MKKPSTLSSLPSAKSSPKIAIISDWLTNMGGAERVILAMHEAFPDAHIYTSVYEPKALPLFKGLDIRTTWLQKLPRPLRKLHKFFPMLRVKAFRDLDLSDYDVIISCTGAEAKQVRKTHDGQVHICYCFTPIRYYWSHYDEYKKDPGFGKLNWLVRLAMPLMIPPLKKADLKAVKGIDSFIAISTETQRRIKKYYGRTSTVIHPPVDTERFRGIAKPLAKRSGYVALGRQVPYKRVDLAVRACTALKLPLTVIGNGSEHDRLVAMAGPSVTFETNATDERVAEILGSAKGFIFPAEEDFGIVQVEALAAGAPVIAYAHGGSEDIVRHNEGGITFRAQNPISLENALMEAEQRSFKPSDLQRVAKRFHKSLFVSKFKKVVSDNAR